MRHFFIAALTSLVPAFGVAAPLYDTSFDTTLNFVVTANNWCRNELTGACFEANPPLFKQNFVMEFQFPAFFGVQQLPDGSWFYSLGRTGQSGTLVRYSIDQGQIPSLDPPKVDLLNDGSSYLRSTLEFSPSGVVERGETSLRFLLISEDDVLSQVLITSAELSRTSVIEDLYRFGMYTYQFPGLFGGSINSSGRIFNLNPVNGFYADDMAIRVVFEPALVPLPAAGWMGLAGSLALFGPKWVRRCLRRRRG